MHPPQVEIRSLREKDLPQVFRLSSGAGWNQVPDDWRAWLDIPRARCWVARRGQNVVGTCSAIDYLGCFGWIGMVIVHPEMRRRGIATQLLQTAIEHLDSSGCRCQRLDATHLGIDLYRGLGFRTEYAVERWTREVAPQPEAPAAESLLRRSQVAVKSLELLDRKAFGASRKDLLSWFLERSQEGCYSGSAILPSGFALYRPGLHASQIGPLVCSDAEKAELLFGQLVGKLSKTPLIADICAENPEAVRILERHGFRKSRSLTRMHRGPLAVAEAPAYSYFLAGFEWG